MYHSHAHIVTSKGLRRAMGAWVCTADYPLLLELVRLARILEVTRW
jgi:hypothetical protein